METPRECTEFKEGRSRPEPGGHQDLQVSKDREGIRDEGAKVEEQVRGVRLEVPDMGGRLREEKPGWAPSAEMACGRYQGWKPSRIRPGVASAGGLRGCRGLGENEVCGFQDKAEGDLQKVHARSISQGTCWEVAAWGGRLKP